MINGFELSPAFRNKLRILFLGVIFTLSVFTTFLCIQHVQQFGPIPCIPIQLVGRTCNEVRAVLYLNQIYKVDSGRNTIFKCGPILNCETSPCADEPVIGKTYWCNTIIRSDDHTFISQNYIRMMNPESFIIILVAVVMMIFSIIVVLFIRRDLNRLAALTFPKGEVSMIDVAVQTSTNIK